MYGTDMNKIIINRKQFEQIKEVFEKQDIDEIVLREESTSGIGPNVYIEYVPSSPVKVDITDYASW